MGICLCPCNMPQQELLAVVPCQTEKVRITDGQGFHSAGMRLIIVGAYKYRVEKYKSYMSLFEVRNTDWPRVNDYHGCMVKCKFTSAQVPFSSCMLSYKFVPWVKCNAIL
jgi:hypothetical protein